MKKNSPGCLAICCDPCIAAEDAFSGDVDGQPPRGVRGWAIISGTWTTEGQSLKYTADPTGNWSPDNTLADDWIFAPDPDGDEWLLPPDRPRDDHDRISFFASSGGAKINLSFYLANVGDQFGLWNVGNTTESIYFFITAGDGETVETTLEIWGGAALVFREQIGLAAPAAQWHELEVCWNGLLEIFINGTQYARFVDALAPASTPMYGVIAGAVADYFLIDDVEERFLADGLHPGCPECSPYCWLDNCGGGELDVTLDNGWRSPGGIYVSADLDGRTFRLAPETPSQWGYRWRGTFAGDNPGDVVTVTVAPYLYLGTWPGWGCEYEIKAVVTPGDPFKLAWFNGLRSTLHFLPAFPVTATANAINIINTQTETAYLACAAGES